MKKLTILRRPYTDTMTRTGLGRYADSIEKCLSEKNIEYNVVPFNVTLNEGYIQLILNGFVRPLRSVLRLRKGNEVFHATDELCGAFFPLMRGKKILTIHHVATKGEYRGSLYYAIWTINTMMALKCSDVVIAISESTKKETIDKFKVDPNKIVCISNRIDDHYVKRDDIKKEKMIGCMGMLIPRKNISSSIIAFKNLLERDGMSDYSMEICGKGPEKNMLLKLAEELGIKEKIRFVSDLSNDEIVSFYNRSALIFNTSLHEGLGSVTIEAQRCGTPVLHLEKAEIPEEVLRFSIGCKDEVEMSQNAHYLLTNNEAYESLSKRSKEYADSFGENNCKEYNKVIANLCSEA